MWSSAPRCPIKVRLNCCVTFKVPREDCAWETPANEEPSRPIPRSLESAVIPVMTEA